MAKIKCETTRFEMVSLASGNASVIVQRRYIRSERIGRRYRNTAFRNEILDAHGLIVHEISGTHFRNPHTGEEFKISDFRRQQRALLVAA